MGTFMQERDIVKFFINILSLGSRYRTRHRHINFYILKSKNLSLILMSPLTPPSPLRGEGKGEGDHQDP